MYNKTNLIIFLLVSISFQTNAEVKISTELRHLDQSAIGKTEDNKRENDILVNDDHKVMIVESRENNNTQLQNNEAKISLDYPKENLISNNIEKNDNDESLSSSKDSRIAPVVINTENINHDSSTPVNQPLVLDKETKLEVNQSCLSITIGFKEEYTGPCTNGLAHGEGTAKGKKGEYSGSFKDGMFDGKGKVFYYSDGSYYSGDFKAGMRHGQGIIFDPSTNTDRVAVFLDDKFVNWLNPSNIKSPRTSQPKRPNYSNRQVSVSANDVRPGMMTAYGKVISIGIDTFTVETMSYDAEGYQRIEKREYPLALLK